MNQVHFFGRLVDDPQSGFTSGNTMYCRFRIAVNRKFAKDGDVQADFFNVISWSKQAEFVSKFFKKGERIFVHGEMRNADYTDKNNVKHYSSEVLANSIAFSGDPKKQEVQAEQMQSAPIPPYPTVPAENMGMPE
ncbi:MAG: single-stranded DNA-binding protein [Oscillospiraceae bacterium]|nr:single-stranded DNA-binding protein [Oscillospiraceae bacterium]